MSNRTIFSILLILSVVCVKETNGGWFNGWFSSTTYTTVNEVSPGRVASYLAPQINNLADTLVNEEKKSREELERFTSEFIQNLSRSFSDDIRGEGKTLKEIMTEMIETHDRAEKNAEKLDETKQAIDRTRGEVDRVEDETFAIYDLLVKIVHTMDKEQDMWTTGEVMWIVIPLGTLTGIQMLAIVWLVYRQHTKTERKLQWLSFCVNAESRFKDELRTNDKANFDVNYTKKNVEYVNPLATKGDDY